MTSSKIIEFNAIESIPLSYWQDLDPDRPLYFDYDFLKAFERSNTNIGFTYLFVVKENKAVGLAISQTISISFKTITKNIRLANWLKQVLDYCFKNRPLVVMFCGNVFLSGEYGIFINKNEDSNDIFSKIAVGLKKQIKKTKKLHTIFIKDFVEESLSVTNLLYSYNYSSLQVEPNMVINIEPSWETFDDYKNQLKSKYRVKVNKADSKSNVLTTHMFEKEDIEVYKSQLQDLYENTISNADFNAQVLNLNTYLELKKSYHDKFILKGYFFEDKLVGFLSAMLYNKALVAHFIGLDYTKNKTYAIYPRILNDYIRLGIETKVSCINLGRTALEIKSTVGARPQALICYAKHKRPLLNKMLKPFIKNIKIKPYKQHQPFKIS